jgi:prevent-host-death family protein
VKVATVADIKANFSAYLRASEQGPVVVTRNGKPVAALVGVGEAEDLERLLMAHSPQLQAILDAARDRFRKGEGIRSKAFWNEMEVETSRKSKPRKSAPKNGRSRR